MPLKATDARTLIRRLLNEGVFVVCDHARKEMSKDKLTDVDAVNVLRAGVVEDAEWVNGSWRYRVRTARMVFVAASEPDFDALPKESDDVSEVELIVVTAWRLRP